MSSTSCTRSAASDRTFATSPGTDGSLADQVDLIANMLLAAVSEAALIIAKADHPRSALKSGLAALDTLIDRLFAPT